MSKLAELRQLQQEMEALEARKKALAESKEVQNEMAFEAGLNELMEKYSYTKADVLRILNPAAAPKSTTSTRKQRTAKVYLNPHTGEEVVTKGGNHKTLKAWKEQYGEEVNTWLQ
jgi:cupin superfamily acireductone dioxygenase involved in methionine salvage